MTDLVALPPDEEADALAAEYVLGVLDLAERTRAEARAKADAGFAARIAAWEVRLAPLNDDFAEVRAPNLLPKIEARLFPKPEKPKLRHRFSWGFLGGVLTAGVLALGMMLANDPVREGPVLTATLAADAAPLAFAASFDVESGQLQLSRTAGTGAETGKDLELWLIAGDGPPVSLGLVRTAELTLDAPGLLPGQTLAISLEPVGGSPTGAPTGPVLVTGVLTEG
jgi:anti-sigma-K factor RskA